MTRNPTLSSEVMSNSCAKGSARESVRESARESARESTRGSVRESARESGRVRKDLIKRKPQKRHTTANVTANGTASVTTNLERELTVMVEGAAEASHPQLTFSRPAVEAVEQVLAAVAEKLTSAVAPDMPKLHQLDVLKAVQQVLGTRLGTRTGNRSGNRTTPRTAPRTGTQSEKAFASKICVAESETEAGVDSTDAVAEDEASSDSEDSENGGSDIMSLAVQAANDLLGQMGLNTPRATGSAENQ